MSASPMYQWTDDGTLEVSCLPVFAPLLQPRRYKGASGGRGSGKSHFFAESLVRKAIAVPGLRWICFREVQKALEQSAKRLVEDKIRDMGLGSYFDPQVSKIVTPGDGVIVFNGMQEHTAESVKSYEGYHGAWGEEAQTISRRSLDLLTPTLRMDPNQYMPAGSEMWFSWNPRFGPNNPNGWDPVDELFKHPDSKDDPDIISVEANYYHNPFFPEVLRKDMERDRRRDPDKYNHIWLGQYVTRTKAQVFSNWRTEYFDTPEDARLCFGADWGFGDPTVLVRCFIGRWVKGKPVADVKGDCLFIDHEAYKVGCEIDNTPALFAGDDYFKPPRWSNPFGWEGVPGATKWPIVADSARPETIAYMRKRGFKIRPAVKGKASVEDGIEFMKNYNIIIHPRCKYTIDEFTLYSWKVDKHTEEVLPVLADKDNNVIDAARYALESTRRAGVSMVEYL